MTYFHGLRLVYRGGEHQHRWSPRCVCGWRGRNKRRRGSAEREYHAHLRAVERRRFSTWRRPSPPEAWPQQDSAGVGVHADRPGTATPTALHPHGAGPPLPMSAGPKAVPDT